jgi:hypothetical protein
MTKRRVLFIQGGGKGAHSADAPLADSLQRTLGPQYDVRLPRMPGDPGRMFLLAIPSWDEDRWNFDDLKPPRDIAEKLAAIPRIFFYHCRDDDVVPFARLALHGARIPRAVTRAVDSGTSLATT